MPSNISDTKSITKSITKSVTSKKLTASYNSTVAAIAKDSYPFWIKAKIISHKKLLVKWKKMVNKVYY